MKKKAALALCMVLATANIIGCSSGAKPENSSTDTAKETENKDEDGVLTLEFFQQKMEEGPQKGYQEIIDRFNEENPDIKIEMNTVPDAATVLTSRIASGDIPVIFSDYPTQQQFKQKVANGYVQELSGQEFLNNVEDSALEMSRQEDGKDYALPYSRNYMGVYYNQEIFDKYDLEIPETWEEFTALCDVLQSNGITPIGIMGKDPARVGHGFQCMTVAWHPEGIEAIEATVAGENKLEEDQGFRQIAEKTVELLSYCNEDILGLADTTCWENFANGQYAMCITGSYARGTLLIANPDLKMGVFPLPNDTKETTNTLAGIDAAVCVSAKASDEEKEAAYKFLAYLAETENAQIFCDKDGAPSCIKEVKPNYEGIEPMMDLINAGQVHDWMASTIDNNIVTDLYNVTQGFWSEKNIDSYLKQMDESIAVTSAE